MLHLAWLGSVYEQYRRELYLTAWSVLRDDDASEDAVQTAFAQLAKLKTTPREPKLYVFRCVRNAALDSARARSRRREAPLAADWDAPGHVTSELDAEMLRSISESLELLEPPEREAIELHLHAALTFKEIAELLEEPLPTVASRYRRALEKLGQRIKVRNE
jgi:RNA polymerase sigma-70 factor (ECF subfamily)